VQNAQFMTDFKYQTKFEPGQEIIMAGTFYTILDLRRENDEPEYKMAIKGRIKWIDATDIDAQAESYNE